MKTSETISKFAAAFCKAQSQIEYATKSSKNPFFKSNYADLSEVIEAIKTPLNNNGISFLQLVNIGEERSIVETILLHESGEFISSETPIFCQKQNDPQALGSGITYSKRYALQAICGLSTEDDDGNKASKKPAKPKGTMSMDEEINAIIDENDVQISKILSWSKTKSTTVEGMEVAEKANVLNKLRSVYS